MALLKTIADRVRSFRSLDNAVEHHGARVAAKLDERFNSLLPEGLRIDFLALMRSIIALLRDACDKLIGTERTHVDERADDERQRRVRDEDAEALSDEILDGRDAFKGTYKPKNIEEFGFPVNIARPPLDLIRQGEHLEAHLTRPDLALPTPLCGQHLPLGPLVERVSAKVQTLRRSLKDVEREQKEAEVAQVEKDRAQDYYDRLFFWGAGFLEGLFVLAGEEELAARVKPSLRRPGRTEEPPADGEGTGAEEPAAEPLPDAAAATPPAG